MPALSAVEVYFKIYILVLYWGRLTFRVEICSFDLYFSKLEMENFVERGFSLAFSFFRFQKGQAIYLEHKDGIRYK